MLRGLSEMLVIKCLAQLLIYNKCSLNTPKLFFSPDDISSMNRECLFSTLVVKQ